jgi:uncharacterized membrane protein
MSKIRILFGALVIVNILLVASIIYVIYEPAPQPSISEQMALTSDDLGRNWTSVVTPGQYSDADVCDIRVVNDTYKAIAFLFIFDNVSECERWFQNQSTITSFPLTTALNISLGDEAILCYNGPSDEPGWINLIFAKDNICYSTTAANFNPDIFSPDVQVKPWWIDTTIWIAQLQLDKIDQYLAEHPGAS